MKTHSNLSYKFNIFKRTDAEREELERMHLQQMNACKPQNEIDMKPPFDSFTFFNYPKWQYIAAAIYLAVSCLSIKLFDINCELFILNSLIFIIAIGIMAMTLKREKNGRGRVNMEEKFSISENTKAGVISGIKKSIPVIVLLLIIHKKDWLMVNLCFASIILVTFIAGDVVCHNRTAIYELLLLKDEENADPVD